MKYALTLKQSGAFAQNPRFAELEPEKILTNDVNLPKEVKAFGSYNPHGVRMFVIGHEFGAICAVFASHDQDALDVATDAGMLDCLQAEEQDYDDESLTACGNASELFDLSHAWIGEVEFEAARDIHLIGALLYAAGAGYDNLSEV